MDGREYSEGGRGGARETRTAGSVDERGLARSTLPCVREQVKGLLRCIACVPEVGSRHP